MINSIQVLRGLAISLVVIYHITAITEDIKNDYYFEFGKIGVDVFFIVSGYIMAFICERNESTNVFIKKRLIRIMPLYITTTILAAVANYGHQLMSGAVDIWSSFVKSLFMIPHYSIANEFKVWPIFIPGWTITYEIWFYTIIAFCISMIRYKKKLLLVPYILSFIYLGAQYLPENAVQAFAGNSVYLTFSVGLLIRFVETKKVSFKKFYFSIFYLVAIAYFFENFDARFILYGLPAFLIFAIIFMWSNLSLKSLAYIGKISFSLYLTHVFTINIVERLMRSYYTNISFGFELMMFVAFVSSIIIAMLIYSLFEKKIDNMLRNKFL